MQSFELKRLNLARVCLLATVLTGTGAAAKDTFLAVRATSAVPDQIISLIANSSIFERMEIHANETPEHFITSVCGNYTMTFEKAFYDANPNIAEDRRPKTTARQVNMPACLKWWRGDNDKGVPIKVRSGDNPLDNLLLREIGRKGSSRLACDPKTYGSRCNVTFRELVALLNPTVKDLDHPNVATLFLPLVTELTTFRIRPGIDPDALRQQIFQLGKQYDPVDGSIITNSLPPPFRLLAKENFTPLDSSCTNAAEVARADNRTWPYDAKQIGDVIRRSLRYAKQHTETIQPVTVTLIDTGLSDGFPTGLLKSKDLHDGKSQYGFSVSRPDSIVPFSNYPLGWHGTRVAQILAFASDLSVNDLSQLLRINIVNVARITADGYDIDPGGLVQAIGYARNTGAEVVNVSIGSESELEWVRQTLGPTKLLIVTAAGNERHEISRDSFPLYPALYGGQDPLAGQHVITVAGYDGDLKLAEFSNWSPFFADIMAPACAITIGTVDDAVDGTSFAAPLVSLTVAIIRAFEDDALYTKTRLQASVDFDASEPPHVLWRGRLNIAKALSLYEDVLEDRTSHKLSFGEWIPAVDYSGEIELCDNAAYNPDTITKIISLRDAEPYSIIVQHSVAAGLLVTEPPCQPRQAGLSFFNSDSKTEAVVSWKDFNDFVKRHFFQYSPRKDSNDNLARQGQ